MRIRIVGAGLIGLATAWELVCRGHDVEVVEAETTGHGASSVAAGMLAPLSEAELFDADLFALGRRGVEDWPEFLGGLGESASIYSCWVAGSQPLHSVSR